MFTHNNISLLLCSIVGLKASPAQIEFDLLFDLTTSTYVNIYQIMNFLTLKYFGIYYTMIKFISYIIFSKK